ncbi:MAG: FGGY-family carbohydrate kinase [Cyanobacteria bacterium J06639_14]
MVYVAGLDFGTSGARITVIDDAATVVAHNQIAYALSLQSDLSNLWLTTLAELLQTLPAAIRQTLDAIAINGTSATVLLCDATGQPLTDPLIYNDDRGQAYRALLETLMPAGSPALSATSSLVKLLWWQANLAPAIFQQAQFLMHQADWLAFHLHGKPGLSDYHNALKLGYDVGELAYPQVVTNLGLTALLPKVQAPGSLIGPILPKASQRYGISSACLIFAGTTDSIAAFLASGASDPGDAVTSLGSTLVLKLLSKTRVDDSRYGIYSHRLGDLWLVGGASNTGGAVLKHYFTDEQLRELSLKIPRDRPSGLDYYPLTKPGERFPINDPDFQPRMTPHPSTPERFLHGLLEGIAQIEAQGYQLLQSLGATPLSNVFTAGGGAHNATWTSIRQQWLPVPLSQAISTEAALGTAKLALCGLSRLIQEKEAHEGPPG